MVDIDPADPGWLVIGAVFLALMGAAVGVGWWLSWRWGRRLAPWAQLRLGVPAPLTVAVGVAVVLAGGAWQHSVNEREVGWTLGVVVPAAALMVGGAWRAARAPRPPRSGSLDG